MLILTFPNKLKSLSLRKDADGVSGNCSHKHFQKFKQLLLKLLLTLGKSSKILYLL